MSTDSPEMLASKRSLIWKGLSRTKVHLALTTMVPDRLVKVDYSHLSITLQDISFGKIAVEESMPVDLPQVLKDTRPLS